MTVRNSSRPIARIFRAPAAPGSRDELLQRFHSSSATLINSKAACQHNRGERGEAAELLDDYAPVPMSVAECPLCAGSELQQPQQRHQVRLRCRLPGGLKDGTEVFGL